ncbi:hypothetical protein EYF80_037443 [Liparis tanakae]|uniref:Uncharacterized protein n=1 Tax=Liparis tanakae TaxID=230148 RepID=A0A4Z2GGF0_9TELE|nr:hypothetical protein EYF80_037443 [Liparis tanakae]
MVENRLPDARYTSSISHCWLGLSSFSGIITTWSLSTQPGNVRLVMWPFILDVQVWIGCRVSAHKTTFAAGSTNQMSLMGSTSGDTTTRPDFISSTPPWTERK